VILDPDGFIGTLLAIEGITDARAVLNGPTGCRGYPAYFSDRHYPREDFLNRGTLKELFFFGQPRIPYTYLDSEDYILGSTQKLQEILPLIAEKGATFLAIVNSPGASLIGDDLKRFLAEAHLDDICMAFEVAAYSRPFPEGFDMAITAVLKWLRLNHLPHIKKRVNLLGFSMFQKYWQGNIAEIMYLCELMGLSVVSVPGAGSSVSEIRESTTASFNIVIFPEYCRKTAEFYESEFGISSVYSPGGAPVGFDATEKWIKTIATATGCDPTPALEEIRKRRRYAYHQIARYNHEAGYPEGTTFAIRGDSSFVLPVTSWLYEYLGMVPVSVELMAGEDADTVDSLKEYLAANNFSEILGTRPALVKPDFYFGDGLSGKDLELSGRCRKSVEIFNRETGDVQFIQKAFLGGEGALWILEQIFTAVENFPG
jgi:Nitrogenase molybdenum-iron protein, alpha and beta chains